MLRVIAGTYKGCRLSTPTGDVSRPTTDRVREAAMSSVASLVGGLEGLSVCDAFAGSGALGIEALSRGAKSCVFCDMSDDALRCTNSNIEVLHLEKSGSPKAVVVRRDVLSLGLPDYSTPYQVVFLDPPYRVCRESVEELILDALKRKIVDEDCLFVYESESQPKKGRSGRQKALHKAELKAIKKAANLQENSQNGLTIITRKEYGKTQIDYIKAI